MQPRITRAWRALCPAWQLMLRIVLIIGVGDLAWPSVAQISPPRLPPPVLELRPDTPMLDMGDWLTLRIDPGAGATLQELLATGDFVPPRPADLRPGYSAAAYWLRLHLHNPSDVLVRRLLQVPPSRLEQVSLFTRIGDGAWQRSEAGTSRPFHIRELPWRISTFSVDLPPGQQMELLLRVASRSAIVLQPQLWEPAALAAHQQRILLADGLILGLLLLLLVLATALARLLRDRGQTFIALFLTIYILYDSSMRGISFMLLWPEATDWAVRALGTFGALGPVLELQAQRHMLAPHRHQPRMDKALNLLTLIILVNIGLMLWGDYRLGTQIASALNIPLLGMMLVVAWRAWRQGQQLASTWLVMLLISLIGLAPRHAELTGLRSHDLFSDYAHSLTGLLASMVVLASMVLSLHRERTQQAQRLEQAVHERTRELAEARARIELSDMVKGRLLGYLGHDLRAPLASTVQVARQLSPEVDFEAGRRAIEHSSLLALEMIDEMQHFARDPQSEARLEILPAPLYLHALLQEIVNQSQALARAGGNRLTLHIAQELPAVVQLDARRLRQVLVNLLANAAKFTRDGQIVMEASTDRTGRLALTVRDNGPGIAMEDLERVFEPFVRGSSADFRPGIGLGLSIVQEMVEAMGGRISVSSHSEQGSSFRLELPWLAAEEDEVQWPPAKPWQARLIGEERLVLLLDPCLGVREALRERLALAQFHCLEAATLHEADGVLVEQPVCLLVAEPDIAPQLPDWLTNWRRRRPTLAVLLCGRRDGPAEAGVPRLLKPAAENEWWPAVEAALGPLRD
jgi:signal transduction histidine kinase